MGDVGVLDRSRPRAIAWPRGCRINQADSHCSSDGGRGKSKIGRFAALVPIQLWIEGGVEVLSHRPIDALASGVVFLTATHERDRCDRRCARASRASGGDDLSRLERRLLLATERPQSKRRRTLVLPAMKRRHQRHAGRTRAANAASRWGGPDFTTPIRGVAKSRPDDPRFKGTRIDDRNRVRTAR